MHSRTAALAALIALLTVSPGIAVARPAAPVAVDAYVSDVFQENVHPEDFLRVVNLEWPLVEDAGAYEVRSPNRGWSFRCQSVFETLTPSDPRTAVVDGLPLEMIFAKGFSATWHLPLGTVTTPGGGTVTLFPAGETEVEIRALPTSTSPIIEASDPVTATVTWRDQPTVSTIAVVPTPWGVRIVRATSGGQLTLAGRLEARVARGTFGQVEQYSRVGSAETWDPLRDLSDYPARGMTSLVLGADPTVWPRYGYVLPGGFTYGRVRAGSTVFDPRTAVVTYRQSFAGDILEVPDDSDQFVRLGASVTDRTYRPKVAPRLGRPTVAQRMGRGTKSWTATISDAARAKAPVRWALYRKKAGVAAGTVPATGWARVARGTARYSSLSGPLSRYRVTVPVSKSGTYRLDVTYPGSSVARPDGFSKSFSAR
ncbi:MAG: hypothetical protein U1E26_02060 [Coriobacteriia bacterium]|nr:hypothetical protein [Coriobacteriia bacterium]